MTVPIPILTAIAVLAIATPVQAQCPGWLEPAFYKIADLSMVEKCLDDGASVDTVTQTGRTPMHLALRYSSDPEPLVRILLRAGADPLARNDRWRTTLHFAALYSRPGAAKLLVAECRACLYTQSKVGHTPLHDAVRAGTEQPGMVRILAGSHFDMKDNDGLTALDLAKVEGKTDMAAMIQDMIINPPPPSRAWWENPLLSGLVGSLITVAAMLLLSFVRHRRNP